MGEQSPEIAQVRTQAECDHLSDHCLAATAEGAAYCIAANACGRADPLAPTQLFPAVREGSDG